MPFSIRLDDATRQELDSAAEKLDRPKGWIVRRAVKDYLATIEDLGRAWRGGARPASAPGLEILGFEKRSRIELPLYLAAVQAGFPSPADDFIDKTLDLNEYLIRHPAATFFVRVAGESMTGAGMHPGDVLVVDRAVEPADNKIVVAVVDGELTVKRIREDRGRLFLAPENPEYPPIEITEETGFEIWGVVTSVIHKL
jgi:DNA polymerase V